MFAQTYRAVLEAYEKFWERIPTGRCTLNLSYTKDSSTRYPGPDGLEEQWLDENYVIGNFRRRTANTGYLAEGIPMLFTNGLSRRHLSADAPYGLV